MSRQAHIECDFVRFGLRIAAHALARFQLLPTLLFPSLHPSWDQIAFTEGGVIVSWQTKVFDNNFHLQPVTIQLGQRQVIKVPSSFFPLVWGMDYEVWVRFVVGQRPSPSRVE